MPKIKTIELLGTTLEGGGQLLRLSTSLAALTSSPICVTQIRGNRGGGGGLKLQHLRAVEWLAQASGAQMVGADKGSKTLEFWPGENVSLSFQFSIYFLFQHYGYIETTRYKITDRNRYW
jgi:RNA 3'-terminal phosphate cyclase